MHSDQKQYNVYPCDDGYHIVYDDFNEVIIAKTNNPDVANGVCTELNAMPEWLDETVNLESVH